MGTGKILTTDWFNLDPAAQPASPGDTTSPFFPWMPPDHLDTGKQMQVFSGRQMIVVDSFTNNGTLIVNGKFVVL